MSHTVLPPLGDARPSWPRRVTFVALGVCIAALLAALATVGANLALSSSADATVFAPTASDGRIDDGVPASLDDDLPAIARLNPALLDAARRAAADAATEGISFQVTSGWRSVEYQRWLFDDAVQKYASEEVAGQFVATPEQSSHVTGDAVDIGPLDAQLWLIEHGSAYGLCQTYANERWHFELATEPGGVCPEMKADASS